MVSPDASYDRVAMLYTMFAGAALVYERRLVRTSVGKSINAVILVLIRALWRMMLMGIF